MLGNQLTMFTAQYLQKISRDNNQQLAGVKYLVASKSYYTLGGQLTMFTTQYLSKISRDNNQILGIVKYLVAPKLFYILGVQLAILNLQYLPKISRKNCGKSDKVKRSGNTQCNCLLRYYQPIIKVLEIPFNYNLRCIFPRF